MNITNSWSEHEISGPHGHCLRFKCRIGFLNVSDVSGAAMVILPRC